MAGEGTAPPGPSQPTPGALLSSDTRGRQNGTQGLSAHAYGLPILRRHRLAHRHLLTLAPITPTAQHLIVTTILRPTTRQRHNVIKLSMRRQRLIVRRNLHATLSTRHTTPHQLPTHPGVPGRPRRAHRHRNHRPNDDKRRYRSTRQARERNAQRGERQRRKLTV